MSNQEQAKKPSLGYSLLTLVAVIGTVIALVFLDVSTQLALFFATIVAVLFSLALKNTYSHIQSSIMKSISETIGGVIILLLVGIMVAVWNASGTLPALIYYGMQVINPAIILPLTFVLCCITSSFIGTSFGTIATVGLVSTSIGVSMGVPAIMLAGAVVSGASFGNKMSPMADTTSIASSMAGVDIYKHIQSMLYSTIPAAGVSLVIYIVLGLTSQAEGVFDTSTLDLILTTIEANFDVGFITVLPLVLILVLTACRVPVFASMSITIVFSMGCAMITQGVELTELTSAAMSGFSGRTEVEQIDNILARGGMASMLSTILSMIFACAMGGALISSKVIDVAIEEGLLKLIKSAKSLVVSTMIYCYSLSFVTGSQALSLMLPAQTLKDTYDKMDVDRRVLSRACADTAPLISPFIPWGGFTMYVCSVLDVSIAYMPYTVLNYLVPVFAVACAMTGIGMWNSKGEKMWGKKTTVKAEVNQ